MLISADTAKVHIKKWNEEIIKLSESSNFSYGGAFPAKTLLATDEKVELLVNDKRKEKFFSIKFSFRVLFRRKVVQTFRFEFSH